MERLALNPLCTSNRHQGRHHVIPCHALAVRSANLASPLVATTAQLCCAHSWAGEASPGNIEGRLLERMTSVQGAGNSGALTAALGVLLAHGGAALLVGQLGHALGFALLRDAQLGILLQCGVLPALLILAQEPLCPAPLLPRKQGPLSGIV